MDVPLEKLHQRVISSTLDKIHQTGNMYVRPRFLAFLANAFKSKIKAIFLRKPIRKPKKFADHEMKLTF